MHRFVADFNGLTQDGSGVYIRYERLSFELIAGERVTLYEPDDFEIEAIIEFDTDNIGNRWCISRFVDGTQRDLPDKRLL